MTDTLEKVYGNRVRIRVCGLLFDGKGILLINHKLGPDGVLWIPPGGEVEMGESLQDALIREFKEETNLDVEVGGFAFGYQYISPPFHAVELFFNIDKWKGTLTKGYDPELTENPLINEVKNVTFQEIGLMSMNHLHGLFAYAKTEEEIRRLSGIISPKTSK